MGITDAVSFLSEVQLEEQRYSKSIAAQEPRPTLLTPVGNTYPRRPYKSHLYVDDSLVTINTRLVHSRCLGVAFRTPPMALGPP